FLAVCWHLKKRCIILSECEYSMYVSLCKCVSDCLSACVCLSVCVCVSVCVPFSLLITFFFLCLSSLSLSRSRAVLCPAPRLTEFYCVTFSNSRTFQSETLSLTREAHFSHRFGMILFLCDLIELAQFLTVQEGGTCLSSACQHLFLQPTLHLSLSIFSLFLSFLLSLSPFLSLSLALYRPFSLSLSLALYLSLSPFLSLSPSLSLFLSLSLSLSLPPSLSLCLYFFHSLSHVMFPPLCSLSPQHIRFLS